LCLYQRGDRREATAQNYIVLQDDPANQQALYNLGAIYANKQQSDSARYYWTKLIVLHPNNELALKAKQNLKLLNGETPL
jgi:TolA-binding protein